MIADIASLVALPFFFFFSYVVWLMAKQFGMTSPRSFRRFWDENRPNREASREALRTNPWLRWVFITIVGFEFASSGLSAYFIFIAEPAPSPPV